MEPGETEEECDPGICDECGREVARRQPAGAAWFTGYEDPSLCEDCYEQLMTALEV